METDDFVVSIKKGQGDILMIQNTITQNLQRLFLDHQRMEKGMKQIGVVTEKLVEEALCVEKLIQTHLNNYY
jgi:hypothetical protein